MGTLCPYLPSLSPLAFGHLPLTRGIGPLAPHFTGPQSGRLGGYRKGAGGSADCFSLVFRYRSLGRRRRHGTPLAESAFGAVGLKLCGGGTAGGWGHPPLQGNRKRGVSERLHGAAPTRGPKSAPSSVWPGGQPPSPPGGRPRRRRIRTAAVSSANPGAQMEPHQRQFLQGQGPMTREESRRPFPFFAPEILLNFSGVRPP